MKRAAFYYRRNYEFFSHAISPAFCVSRWFLFPMKMRSRPRDGIWITRGRYAITRVLCTRVYARLLLRDIFADLLSHRALAYSSRPTSFSYRVLCNRLVSDKIYIYYETPRLLRTCIINWGASRWLTRYPNALESDARRQNCDHQSLHWEIINGTYR